MLPTDGPRASYSLVALTLAVVAGAGALDCTAAVAPAPELEFRVLEQTTSVQEEGATAEVRDGTLVVEGVTVTPTPCWRVSGSVETDGGVRLLVQAREEDVGACVQAIAFTRYEARIGRLDAGEHRVEVAHRVGDGEAETVLETTVTVP